MDNIVTMDDFKKEARKVKVRRTIDKVKMSLANAGQWLWDHKVEVASAVTVAVGAVAEGRRVYDRVHAAREDYKSDRSIYDPSLHKTVDLKRKLTKAQKRELFERKSNGEKIHDILADMNVTR